jgi:mannose/cellobiose epimerase-like protein (N-acyl-D-glucosamine 2-epimerase family)
MSLPHAGMPRAQLGALRETFNEWLVDAAYPLWSTRGVDPRNGGFVETLGQDGLPLPHPRRARLHPRQVHAFAQAPRLGWRGDASGIVERGMEYFSTCYQRADGLFLTLADADGVALDERALLYDQAFALLGFAAAAVTLDARGRFEAQALRLRRAIDSRLRAGDGAFHTDEDGSDHRESNPHMHLLEACLAWAEIGNDAGWVEWVRGLSGLALAHFIRADSGALGETFTAEVLDDFTVHDGNARVWPQTERLKAALLAATLTGESRYWSTAHAAAASFVPYLATTIPGLWYDVRRANGELVNAPVPASTFYHLVGAILALESTWN